MIPVKNLKKKSKGTRGIWYEEFGFWYEFMSFKLPGMSD